VKDRCRTDPSAAPRTRWRLYLLVLLCGFALEALSLTAADAAGDQIRVLSIDGVINPLTAQYLQRGLEDGADGPVAAVVVRLNTPGGLASATGEITQAMLNAAVPVVVYVAPAGARAASAGMFITIAGHVAAMAPGTHIGAAHPVGLGGDVDPVMSEKLTHDAAAAARAIAVARGRNAAWAEQAVRESVSITAAEALDQNVIDLIARDLPDLLHQLDGRQIETAAGPVTLRTADARLIDTPMTLPERLLQVLADPNIAYVLLTIGTVGLIAELYNPGALFPGITGVIALVLAFMGLGNLPVNWAGLLLLLLAMGLFVAEVLTAGIGILAAGGLAAFVLGSLLLFAPFTPVAPTMPEVRVTPWLIAGMAAGLAAFFLLVLRALLQARRAPVLAGPEMLVGRVGVATSDLAPTGTVQVDGEVWSALATDGEIRAGAAVQVVGVEGVTLRVQTVA
jgi:membrane-bound serine protease (ClpP class)